MNYIILIIVAFVGIALGMYLARRKANAGLIAEQKEIVKKLDALSEKDRSGGFLFP